MSTTNPSTYKSRGTAIILALFLGEFGLHKFYLGDTFAGVMYLVFSCTFIPAVLGVIEGVIYILMSEEEFQRKYG